MSNEVKWYLRLIDKSRDATRSFGNGIEALKTRTNKTIGAISAGFAKLKGVIMAAGAAIGVGGVGGLAGGFLLLGASIRAAFKMERIQLQFKTLLGSVDAAKQRLAELSDFAAKTPFQLEGLAQASRQLEIFTGGALGKVDSTFRLIGDAAAGANVDIQEVSFWVGRLYSALQNGQPIGEASLRMMELGLLSGSAKVKLEELSKSGASLETKFAVVVKELERFKGGMESLSTSGEGVVSTLKDVWEQVLSTFGEAFTKDAKGGITALTEALNRLKEDGSIAEWAENANAALHIVINAASDAIEKLTDLKNLMADTKGFGKDIVDIPWNVATGQPLMQNTKAAAQRRTDEIIEPLKEELARQEKRLENAKLESFRRALSGEPSPGSGGGGGGGGAPVQAYKTPGGGIVLTNTSNVDQGVQLVSNMNVTTATPNAPTGESAGTNAVVGAVRDLGNKIEKATSID